MELSRIAERALEAYGGRARWSSASGIEAEYSAHGLAFVLKWQRPFVHARAALELARPFFRVKPIDGRDKVGVLDGNKVRIEDADGKVLETRDDPRRFFPGGRRMLYWDVLDHTYFSCYAAWNYLTLPSLLLREDISWREAGENLLEAVFPPGFPTHSPVQRFHFDPSTGLLRRHDYTALVIGNWANASMTILENRSFDGVVVGSLRRGTPRTANGTVRPWPLLVEMRVHDFKLIG